MLELDHVVYAVKDLDAAAERLLDEHGLASVPGGEHTGAGTANRIVPLGETYLELMAVVDRDAASPMAAFLQSFLSSGDALLAWAVRTDDIEHVGRRIGAKPVPWSRTRPDGTLLTWRLAGTDGAFADRSLPFFIQWDCPPDDHPGRATVQHRRSPVGIANLEIAGDRTTIIKRLGRQTMPITVVTGEPGPISVTITTDDGEIVLR